MVTFEKLDQIVADTAAKKHKPLRTAALLLLSCRLLILQEEFFTVFSDN